MDSQRTRVLLGIVAALLLLRLVAVPWINSQAEQRQRLQVLTQRLDRSIGVVGNRDQILAARQALTAEADAVRGRFPVVEDPEAHRLELQRALGALAAANGVTLGLFDWLLDGRSDDAGLAYGRVRLRMEGSVQDLVRVHGALEGGLPHVVVKEWSLELRDPAPAPDQTRGAAVFVVDVHYRSAAPARLAAKASA